MKGIGHDIPSPGNWFEEARYGLFVHYGLYSLLARGEWVQNREGIARDEYAGLADRFRAERFDADALCQLAWAAGMRYLVFTSMHHDGFRLYGSRLSGFTSVATAARRDLVREVVDAARRHGLRVGLYHSLNNWHDSPDAVSALEDPQAREYFVTATHQRLVELAELFPDIDVLWYDGWWPFDAEGWRAEEMNAAIRRKIPGLLFNGRNGLAGDFATPEGHLGSPRPWRAWEACMPTNENWGYHGGDHAWKSPRAIAEMLIRVAAGRGNLLLNVGPRGDGSLPDEAVSALTRVGDWLAVAGEAIYGTELFNWDLRERTGYRADWSHHGPFTAKGHILYWHILHWPGVVAVLSGLQCTVRSVSLLGGASFSFRQSGDRLVITGLGDAPPRDQLVPVLRLECDGPPGLYLTAGLRVPRVTHPHYDPCPSDMLPR